MYQKLSFLILLSFVFVSTKAQHIHKCYTDEYVQLLNEKNPNFKNQMNDLFDLAHEIAQLKATNGELDTIFRIPVVFHVVYNGPQQNISDALLQSQIDVLNEDYRRLNADTTNTRPIFKDRAADVGFEFFLATADPEGNITNGITRTPTTSTFSFFNLDDMKSDATGGKDAWDTQNYLNIWVCDLGGAILGFAYPPAAAPNWPSNQLPSDPSLEGVVIHYEVVGLNNPLATGQLSIADKGRTAVHEVGHFFGLRHIWGDSGGIFGGVDCDITADDGFDDTPHMGSNSQTQGCSFSKNTCTNGEQPDEPDMVENYMDYSTEACQNMFTQQQADLMRSMAVIGRTNLPVYLENASYTNEDSLYIVINGTDTFIVGVDEFSINPNDEVVVLNLNNAYPYENSSSYTYSSGDNVQVDVNEDGEISFSNQTSIRNDYNTINITIYPNPTKTIINLKWESTTNVEIVKIYSLSGQLVLEIKNNEMNLAKINVENLTNGIYFVELGNQNQTLAVQKFSILK